MHLKTSLLLLTFLLCLGCGQKDEKAPNAQGEAPAQQAGTGTGVGPSQPTANSDTTKYGTVQAEVKPMLYMRQAARDGGAFYETQAAVGKKFLVISFPETQRRKEQIIYEDDKVRLLLEGGPELESHSVAAGGVNNEAALLRGDPPRFETEIWMSTINDANAYPFAVAFEVPEGSQKAWLKVEDQTLEIGF